MSQQKHLISEPPKNDAMEFESIDERALSMLIDSGDNAMASKLAAVSEMPELDTTTTPPYRYIGLWLGPYPARRTGAYDPIREQNKIRFRQRNPPQQHQ